MATDKRFISPDSYKDSLRDNLRKVTGQYWYTDASGILKYGDEETVISGDPEVSSDVSSFEFSPQAVFGRGQGTKIISLKQVDHDEVDYGAFIPFQEDSILYDNSSNPERVMVIEVTATNDDDNYTTLTQFSIDTQNLFQNPPEGFFFEESFKYSMPDTDDQEKVEAVSEYNFLSEKYENLSSTTQESALPNFYGISLINIDETNTPDKVKQHTLLLENIDVDTITISGVVRDDGSTVLDEYQASLLTPYEEYYKQWTTSYIDLTFSEQSSIIDGAKNILQTYNSYTDGVSGVLGDQINDLNERSRKLPFTVTLSIPSENNQETLETSEIVNLIGQENLFSSWTTLTVSSIIPSVFTSVEEREIFGFAQKTYWDIDNPTNLLASPSLTKIEQGGSLSELNTFSFTHLAYEDFSPIYDSSAAFIQSDRSVILDSADSRELNITEDLQNDFESSISEYDINTSLSQYVQTVHESADSFENRVATEDGRLYEAIFNRGDFSENHTVAYRVKKYRGASATGQPVQDIWVPNASPGNSILEYIDSQVRYGEQYTYDIYAYKYVFGSKYKYEQHLPPQVSTVEQEVDTEGEVIGYTFKWFGAKNLFDVDQENENINGPQLPESGRYGAQVWELVASYLNQYGSLNLPLIPVPWSLDYSSPDDLSFYDGTSASQVTDTFWLFNHFISPSQYPVLGTGNEDVVAQALQDRGVFALATPGVPVLPDITRWPAWGDNSRFFTLEQIRSVMSKAWYTKPTGLENGVLRTYQSWQEMWGGEEWNDTWVSDNVGTFVRYELVRILRGEAQAVNELPVDQLSTLSLTEWFALFMGYDSGTIATRFSISTSASPPQPMPPSHHRINGKYIPNAYSSDGLFGDSGPRNSLPESNQNNLNTFTSLASYQGNFYTGIETSGGGEFHDGDKGVSELIAGEGVPIYITTGYKAQYRIHILPSTRIVEVPYGTVTTAVLSKPPPTPEVEVHLEE